MLAKRARAEGQNAEDERFTVCVVTFREPFLSLQSQIFYESSTKWILVDIRSNCMS